MQVNLVFFHRAFTLSLCFHLIIEGFIKVMHADVTARLAGVIMHNREDPVIPIGASKWSSVDYSPSKV
jgi:hypothetical protein